MKALVSTWLKICRVSVAVSECRATIDVFANFEQYWCHSKHASPLRRTFTSGIYENNVLSLKTTDLEFIVKNRKSKILHRSPNELNVTRRPKLTKLKSINDTKGSITTIALYPVGENCMVKAGIMASLATVTKDVEVEDISTPSRQRRACDDRRGAESKNSGGESPSDAALRRPRKSLPFLPRTSQYERNPLLQTRSTATGLSEFDLLMLEKDELTRRKSCVDSSSRNRQKSNANDVQQQSSDSDPTRPPLGRRLTLVPRGAQYEPHPLFVRSESGVCELETYLSEIASTSASKSTAVDNDSTANGNGKSCLSINLTPSSTTNSTKKLEPRTSQWERHTLLEIRDASGMTELDRLLMEKDQEVLPAKRNDENECVSATSSSRCSDCGAERSSTVQCSCTKDQSVHNDATPDADRDDPLLAAATPEVDENCEVASSSSAAHQKRVRFVANRKKSDAEEKNPRVVDGKTPTTSDGNDETKCQTRKQNSGRDADAVGDQRKRCCVS